MAGDSGSNFHYFLISGVKVGGVETVWPPGRQALALDEAVWDPLLSDGSRSAL